MALEGVKVIDCSQVAAVPIAARHLGDFGADVIHVEHPVTGDFWRGFQEAQTEGGGGARRPSAVSPREGPSAGLYWASTGHPPQGEKRHPRPQ